MITPQIVHLTINKVALHTLYSGRKLIKSIGPLQLIQKDNTLYIRINHWYVIEIFKHQQFYKIQYHYYNAFIVENIAGGFYSISIANNDPGLDLFQNKLKQFTEVIDLKSLNKSQEFQKKIEYHYPEIQDHPIHTDDLFTPFFSLGSKFQNTIGNNLKPSVIDSSIRNRTKNVFLRGWNAIKRGFTRANQKSNQIPLVLQTKQFASQAVTKISESTKKVVEGLSSQKQPSNL